MNEPQESTPAPDRKPRDLKRGLVVALLLAIGLSFVIPSGGASVERGDPVLYSEALSAIRSGDVTKAWVDDNSEILVLLADGGTRTHTNYPIGSSQDVLDLLDDADVEIEVLPRQSPGLFSSLLLSMLPVFLILAFIVILTRRGGMGGMGLMSLGKSKAAPVDVPATRFSDVAGIDDALADLQEIVDFLHNPDRYVTTGASRPRGFLLVGPPGTGKTLLARAVAGEAGVPFYAITGADFVELFAGLGASRVRDLFAKARSQEKAIIFIDEIDAVGKARGSGIQTGANDERENTLNALLVELDGFTTRDNIVILAATNRADVLDPALLRPGRFDRTIIVPPPDRGGRLKLLELYARDKPFSGDVDWEILARRTPGMTGAQIAQLLNEAALEAARKGSPSISAEHLETALQTTVLGRERRGAVVTDRDRRIVAWHEAGHALCALLTDEADDPVQVSIIPRGGTGGATWMTGGEHDLTTRSQARAQLIVSMGGRAAEEILLDGDFTQGSHGDLAAATRLATEMVARYGMGRDLISRGSDKLVFDGPVGLAVDREVADIIEQSLTAARALLLGNRTILERVAEELLDKENLSLEDLQRLLGEASPQAGPDAKSISTE